MLKMTTALTTTGGAIQVQIGLNENLVDRFIRFAGVSEKSALTYKIALRQLFKYFAANAISQPSRSDVENWRDGLIAQKKSPATVQLYLTSAKIFFRWLSQENLYTNITDHMKARVKVNHEHKKDALTAAQAGNLIQSVEGKSLKSKRDKAILALMATAGVRCIEVERATVGDVIEQFGRVYLLIQGKGHSAKDAKVLLPAQVVALIRDYLAARGNVTADAPLFASVANRNRGQKISAQLISKMVKSTLRRAGYDTPRLTAHSLRHTAATAMIIAGVDLTQVQQVLRHVNINTTMIYNNAISRMKNTAEQVAADAIFGYGGICMARPKTLTAEATRSARVSLLMTPKLYDDVTTLARIKKMSLNDLFNQLAAQVVDKNHEAIDAVQSAMAAAEPTVNLSIVDGQSLLKNL